LCAQVEELSGWPFFIGETNVARGNNSKKLNIEDLTGLDRKELAEFLIQVISSGDVFSGGKKDAPHEEKHESHVFCNVCDKRMVLRKTGKPEYEQYFCWNTKGGDESHRSYRKEDVDSVVAPILEALPPDVEVEKIVLMTKPLSKPLEQMSEEEIGELYRKGRLIRRDLEGMYSVAQIYKKFGKTGRYSRMDWEPVITIRRKL
jgi:hypothetical protein